EAEDRNRVLFVATAGLLLIAAGIARLVARRATEPVRALTRAAERVASGDLGVRIASGRRDEVRRLVDAFNRMAVELERQRAVLLPLPPGEGEGEAPGRMVLLEDITDIVRSKKLDAWAEMARRVAHEVRNPLTPIQLSAEHLKRVYERGGDGFAAVLEACVG